MASAWLAVATTEEVDIRVLEAVMEGQDAAGEVEVMASEVVRRAAASRAVAAKGMVAEVDMAEVVWAWWPKASST